MTHHGDMGTEASNCNLPWALGRYNPAQVLLEGLREIQFGPFKQHLSRVRYGEIVVTNG